MDLIIAEKPTQANSYVAVFKNSKKHEGYYEIPPCSIFPEGALLTWGYGHLVGLKEPHEYTGQDHLQKWNVNHLPIIPSAFEYKVTETSKKQFAIVKKLIQESKTIVIGTDCDREGENIAYSIIKLAGGMQKPKKRLWINSMEEEEVLKGFQNLKDASIYYPYYEEAQARQISDWLVGLNASRLYTLLLQNKGVNEIFSVGRVQTPSLKLIYDREQVIKNFISKPFYHLEATFSKENEKYIGKLKDRFESEEELLKLISERKITTNTEMTGLITEVKKEIKKTNPPKLHSLSSLQTLANKKFKYSPSQVLEIVQKLYENPLKLVTYPRTDTQYITNNEFSYLKENLNNYQKVSGCIFEPYSLEANKRYVDGSKVQEHYAIIPTKKIPSEKILNELTIEQRNIYFEILKSALAMFHSPYLYEETNIKTDVNGVVFETKGKIEKSKGWKELYSYEAEDDNDEEKSNLLPDVTEGIKVSSKVGITEGATTPPKRYTEGELINMMKHCGKSIENITEEEKAILEEVEGLGTEATRSGIIETLKRQKYIEVKKNVVYVTKKGEILCQVVDGTLLSKPELTAKWESYLKRIGQKSGNKETFIQNTTQFIKSVVDNTKKSINDINIDESIKEINEVDHIALCPLCKKGYMVDKKSFYGCNEYKNGCTMTIPKKKNEKTLSNSNIKQLCEKGKTNKLKGFKKFNQVEKKYGKETFEATLILEDGGKLSFSFQ